MKLSLGSRKIVLSLLFLFFSQAGLASQHFKQYFSLFLKHQLKPRGDIGLLCEQATYLSMKQRLDPKKFLLLQNVIYQPAKKEGERRTNSTGHAPHDSSA